eukprot:TRINITY_DN29487_c0_g2_i1.p1 TRINITY_DN29487_c0_g2~~TRINITY_DN29487_c0_g2_i1.p1  ORF type:complete len:318 (+),score=90.43 TRINITY_DN29487_c0_g2_i1:117-1070(+)
MCIRDRLDALELAVHLTVQHFGFDADMEMVASFLDKSDRRTLSACWPTNAWELLRLNGLDHLGLAEVAEYFDQVCEIPYTPLAYRTVDELQAAAAALAPEVAEPLLRRAVQMCIEHSADLVSPELWKSMLALGRTLSRLGQAPEALLILEGARSALEQQEAGEVWRERCAVMNELARLHVGCGRIWEAVPVLERCVTEVRVGSPGSAELAVLLNNLGGLLMHSGSLQRALGCFTEAVEIRSQNRDMQGREMEEALANLAGCKLQIRDGTAGDGTMLEQALKIESQARLAVSYTHLRAHETPEHLVCRLLLEKKKKKI